MFKIDVNYLDSMTRVSQATGKIEDPVKKIIHKGLQSSCTIFVKDGKNQWSGSGFHIGMGMIVTAMIRQSKGNFGKVCQLFLIKKITV